MTFTPEQISEIVLKVLKEVNEPDVSSLSYQEKKELARNPNTPVETLKVLATDKDFNVRCWVTLNLSTPVENLKVLATDKDSYVRCGVAENPNTPVENLKVLATDKFSYVRYAVASNPNYKSKTLELTTVQYNALKTLLASSQDESLKTLTL